MDGFSWNSFSAVLFDLDGVITPTASVHERAWSELFAPWVFLLRACGVLHLFDLEPGVFGQAQLYQ